MSDTVAVALIAVAGTLGSGALSYVAAKRNTQVQLAAVEMDLRHLQTTHAEEARQERAEVYHDFLTSADAVEELARGIRGPMTVDAFSDAIGGMSRGFNNVILLGDERVIPKAEELMAAIAGFSRTVADMADTDPDLSQREIYGAAMEQSSDDWAAARNQMRRAMREDIKRPNVS
jgi:hypothetical protein